MKRNNIKEIIENKTNKEMTFLEKQLIVTDVFMDVCLYLDFTEKEMANLARTIATTYDLFKEEISELANIIEEVINSETKDSMH